MAALTVSSVRPVVVVEQFTAPAGVAITAGQMVTVDGTTGKLALAGATASGVFGVALHKAAAGEPVTVLLQGVVDIGDALDGLGYNAPVYAGASGGLDDTGATGSAIVGNVIPGFGHTTPDKLLRVAAAHGAKAA